MDADRLPSDAGAVSGGDVARALAELAGQCAPPRPDWSGRVRARVARQRARRRRAGAALTGVGVFGAAALAGVYAFGGSPRHVRSAMPTVRVVASAASSSSAPPLGGVGGAWPGARNVTVLFNGLVNSGRKQDVPMMLVEGTPADTGVRSAAVLVGPSNGTAVAPAGMRLAALAPIPAAPPDQTALSLTFAFTSTPHLMVALVVIACDGTLAGVGDNPSVGKSGIADGRTAFGFATDAAPEMVACVGTRSDSETNKVLFKGPAHSATLPWGTVSLETGETMGLPPTKDVTVSPTPPGAPSSL